MQHIPDFEEILITEKKLTLYEIPRQILSINSLPLSKKVDEYILRLGHENMYLLNILMELFINGRVSVDFRNYRDRLELVDSALVLTRSQVVLLFEDYIQKFLQSEENAEGSQSTQKIILQPPRISLPPQKKN